MMLSSLQKTMQTTTASVCVILELTNLTLRKQYSLSPIKTRAMGRLFEKSIAPSCACMRGVGADLSNFPSKKTVSLAKGFLSKLKYPRAASVRVDVSREGSANGLESSGSSVNNRKFKKLGKAEDQATEAPSAVNEAKDMAPLSDKREVVVTESTIEVAERRKQEDRRSTEKDDALFRRKLSLAKDADEALRMIREEEPGREGEISSWECSQMILAAVEEDNMELAFSVLDAIRRSNTVQNPTLQKPKEDMVPKGRNNLHLRWAQPDVSVYATFIRGLAASLRVSDAVKIVEHMRRRGVPVGKEVAFGKVVSCPTCKKSLAVVQPQHGIQIVPCSQCRYNYELMSGDVISFKSDSISNDWSLVEMWLRQLPIVDKPLPMAVHSFVVQDPDGLARILRFATESVDVPAREGERVTFVSAAPSSAEKRIGPFRLSRRTPGWRPSEPMAITNHITSITTPLLRAPPQADSGAAFDRAFIIPALLTLAGGDVMTALIDPSLPRLMATYVAASLALGGVFNVLIYPRLNLLPQRTADAVASRQKLLAQYQSLQQRIQKLSQAAISEVRMMARMFQLQNKMQAVGEPTYSARIVRVEKAQDGIYQQLLKRLELIDRYAKVASMIEIEVEMEVDVLAAEAVAEVEHVMEQIESLMEADDLQKEWTVQAEASDEVERLLNLIPLSPRSS